jgi:hypothetical protein
LLPVFEVKEEISVLFVFMSGPANKTALWKWGLSGALVILIAVLATNRGFYDSSMTSAFLSLALATGAWGQVPAPEVQIAGALSAAPEALRADATVLGYRNYHLLTTLREGTGAMICIADDPSESGWHVVCYHRDLEPFMKLGRDLTAAGGSRSQVDSARLAAIQAGTLKMPDGPRMLYNLYAPGDSVDSATGLARGAVRLDFDDDGGGFLIALQ